MFIQLHTYFVHYFFFSKNMYFKNNRELKFSKIKFILLFNLIAPAVEETLYCE